MVVVIHSLHDNLHDARPSTDKTAFHDAVRAERVLYSVCYGDENVIDGGLIYAK